MSATVGPLGDSLLILAIGILGYPLFSTVTVKNRLLQTINFIYPSLFQSFA